LKIGPMAFQLENGAISRKYSLPNRIFYRPNETSMRPENGSHK